MSSERDNLRYSREGYYCIQGVTNLSFELQMMDENDLQFTFKFTTSLLLFIGESIGDGDSRRMRSDFLERALI